MTETYSSWFLLQFKPNSHHLAERNLERQGFKTFLPLQEVTQRRSTRFVSDLRPLFPGYFFVAFNPQSGSWSKINGTVGVSRLVSFGSIPKLVPTELITSLKRRCDPTGKLRPAEMFEQGDYVKIINGPFSSFVATVEKLDAQKRVWVLIDLIGRKSLVKVPSDQLQTIY